MIKDLFLAFIAISLYVMAEGIAAAILERIN